MPDNWNILASLLGTPRPPEPVKKTEPVAEKPAEQPPTPMAEPEAAGDDASPPEEDADTLSPVIAEPEAMRKSASESLAPSEPEDVDVLEALTATTPPPKLPGFGVSDEPDLDESADQSSGFGDVEEQINQRDSKLSAGRRGPRSDSKDKERDASSRPPRRRGKPSGFGGGLVDDDESDLGESTDLDSSIDADSSIDEPISSQKQDSPARREPSARRSSRSEPDARESSDSPAPRRRGRRGQRQRMSETDVVAKAKGPDRDEIGFGSFDEVDEEPSRDDKPAHSESREPARRGRSRRGGQNEPAASNDDRPPRSGRRGRENGRDDGRSRGRVESDHDVVESDRDATVAKDDDSKPSRSRGRRGGHSRDNQNNQGAPRRSAREDLRAAAKASDSDSFDEDDDDVGFAADLFDGDDSLFGGDSVSDEGTADEDQKSTDDDGPRAGRRTRRRGRGRGRKSTTDHDEVQNERSEDDLPRSAFGDDDDAFVSNKGDSEADEELSAPRGRSRNSSRSRDEATSSDEDPTSGRGRRRGRGGRSRDDEADSRSTRESRSTRDSSSRDNGSSRSEGRGDRPTEEFPTWHEIVNVMVDKNLGNRRSGGGGGNSRGGNSRGGGRGGSRGSSRGGSRRG